MKKLISVTICFIFLGVISSFAEESQDHTWELGTETSYITYKEPDVMQEEGLMYGITGSATEYKENLMGRVDGRFSYGEVDYKNSGTLNDITDYMWEARGVLGYGFHMSEAFVFTPYLGFGYRYLNDDSGGMTTSTGAKGYERESNYYYSPIGIETTASFAYRWSIGMALEYDHFWRGRQISHIGDAIAGVSSLDNDQNDGYGLRGSFRLLKKGEKADIAIEPFIRYWNIDQSDESPVTYAGVIVGTGYEPKNNSTEYGGKLAVRF